jgi:hypothetical protein
MRRVCLPGLLGIALLAGGATFGADQPTTTKTDSQIKTTDSGKHTANKPVAPEGSKAVDESKKASRTRLPAHFGKIGLSAEQREHMKAVMDKYAGQIKDLEAKLSEVKAQRDGEVHALLTEAQKKAVEEAKALAEKVRKERAAAARKAIADSEGRLRDVRAGFAARQKLIQDKMAQFKADQEKGSPQDRNERIDFDREATREEITRPRRIHGFKRGRHRVPSFRFKAGPIRLVTKGDSLHGSSAVDMLIYR